MTADEIIKGLTICSLVNYPGDCDDSCPNCPYYECLECNHFLHMDSIALINKLQIENRILSQKRISFPERLEITNKARLSGATDYVKQLKQKIYGYDVMWSTESIYYTMDKLLKEWEEHTKC